MDRTPWLVVTIPLALAVLITVGLLWSPAPPPASTPPAAVTGEGEVAAQRLRNQELAQRIARLQEELAAPCPPAPHLEEGHSPPSAPDRPTVNASPTPPAGAPPAAGERIPPGPLHRMVETIGGATVLVVAREGSGTGFFVAPGYLVTNRHVVEGSPEGTVLITSRTLGGMHKGRVVALTPRSRRNGADYALIRLATTAPVGLLPFTTRVAPLTEVVAAGFPALVMQNDRKFQALLKGDVGAIPEMTFTRGHVSAIQNRESGEPTVAHTALISGGNSGGPLVDLCGRVVGINTFIAVEQDQAGKMGFAMGSENLMAFLQGQGVPFQRHDQSCAR